MSAPQWRRTRPVNKILSYTSARGPTVEFTYHSFPWVQFGGADSKSQYGILHSITYHHGFTFTQPKFGIEVRGIGLVAKFSPPPPFSRISVHILLLFPCRKIRLILPNIATTIPSKDMDPVICGQLANRSETARVLAISEHPSNWYVGFLFRGWRSVVVKVESGFAEEAAWIRASSPVNLIFNPPPLQRRPSVLPYRYRGWIAFLQSPKVYRKLAYNCITARSTFPVMPLHPALEAAIRAPASRSDKPGALYAFKIPAHQPNQRKRRAAARVYRSKAKIGRSNDPPRRKGEWARRCRGQLQEWHCYWQVPEAAKFEALIHLHFKIKGAWIHSSECDFCERCHCEIFDLAICGGWPGITEVVVYYLRRLNWPVIHSLLKWQLELDLSKRILQRLAGSRCKVMALSAWTSSGTGPWGAGAERNGKPHYPPRVTTHPMRVARSATPHQRRNEGLASEAGEAKTAAKLAQRARNKGRVLALLYHWPPGLPASALMGARPSKQASGARMLESVKTGAVQVRHRPKSWSDHQAGVLRGLQCKQWVVSTGIGDKDRTGATLLGHHREGTAWHETMPCSNGVGHLRNRSTSAWLGKAALEYGLGYDLEDEQPEGQSMKREAAGSALELLRDDDRVTEDAAKAVRHGNAASVRACASPWTVTRDRAQNGRDRPWSDAEVPVREAEPRMEMSHCGRCVAIGRPESLLPGYGPTIIVGAAVPPAERWCARAAEKNGDEAREAGLNEKARGAHRVLGGRNRNSGTGKKLKAATGPKTKQIEGARLGVKDTKTKRCPLGVSGVAAMALQCSYAQDKALSLDNLLGAAHAFGKPRPRKRRYTGFVRGSEYNGKDQSEETVQKSEESRVRGEGRERAGRVTGSRSRHALTSRLSRTRRRRPGGSDASVAVFGSFATSTRATRTTGPKLAYLLERSQSFEQLLPFHHLRQPKARLHVGSDGMQVRFAQLEMAVLDQGPGGDWEKISVLQSKGFSRCRKWNTPRLTKLSGDQQGLRDAVLANFASRFLPPLIAAYRSYPCPGSSYTSAVIALLDSPYFVRYIRRITIGYTLLMFQANHMQHQQVSLPDQDSGGNVAILGSLIILHFLLFYAQQFPRHLGALFKNSRYRLLEWLNHVKIASKSVLCSSQLESCDVELFDDISRFACEPFNGVTDHVCHRWRPNESSAAGVVPSHTVAKVSGPSAKQHIVLMNSTSSPENGLASPQAALFPHELLGLYTSKSPRSSRITRHGPKTTAHAAALAAIELTCIGGAMEGCGTTSLARYHSHTPGRRGKKSAHQIPFVVVKLRLRIGAGSGVSASARAPAAGKPGCCSHDRGGGRQERCYETILQDARGGKWAVRTRREVGGSLFSAGGG
ncbi:hypothetical protein C8R47DRAFT_1082731 [Mycena vitilis]|nr:hypothetical protein C8R47DRAFT_1082731 [Mycena vitilis]